MDEKTYLCPLCEENVSCIYGHPLGGKVLLPGNVYILGMCLLCLRTNDPRYEEMLRNLNKQKDKKKVIPKDY